MKLNTNTKTETRRYNAPIYGMKGEFTLSTDVAVPYFAALLDIRRMALELKTHEQVAASLDQTYNLQELYQREIDTDRIEKDLIKNYLQDPNKIKFFNSLTVVLLPKDDQGKIIPEFGKHPDNDPSIPSDGGGDWDANFSEYDRITFGGVQFVQSTAAGISRLRWDDTRVDAVAVDGQHRLTALMRWFENHKNKSLNATETRTLVPIIFLLLSDEAGFKKGAHHAGKGIKAIAREIFTDLNKNAKTVDKATEIILDDRNLISRCVRELVTDETCQDSDSKLPLSLVRWRDANNRFDKDYFLNSLVHLSVMVDDILDLQIPSKSGMDKNGVQKFINDISKKLGDASQKLVSDGEDLDAYYQKNYLDETTGDPISPMTGVPSRFMDAAVEGFKTKYAPWMVSLMTSLTPYKNLLCYARENDIIKGIFAQYQSQPASHQQSLKAQLEATHGINWQDDIIRKHRDTIEKIKGDAASEVGEEWLFKAIFQKALIRLGKAVCVDTPVDELKKVGGVNDIIDFINQAHACGLLNVKSSCAGISKYLWTAIGLNLVNPTIKVSGASEDRIFDLLCVWYFATRYQKHMDSIADETWIKTSDSNRPAEIVKLFQLKKTKAIWPIGTSCDDLLDVFKKDAHHLLSKEPDDITDEERDAFSRDRLVKIISLVLASSVSKEDSDEKSEEYTTEDKI